MKRSLGAVMLAGLAGALSVDSPLHAVNRFFLNNQTLRLGSTGNMISLMADLDQATYGFSIHLQYDAAKIRVNSVQLGNAAAALTPEYSEGTISNSPGRVLHGVVFDITGPTITKNLAAGSGREVLRFNVDVLAAAQTTVLLDLVNVPGNPSRLNVMTNQNGDSVIPAPTLVDGTLTLSPPPAPIIEGYSNNSGPPGQRFFITGQNFDQPGLEVMVCAKPAVHTVLDGQNLDVTAPDCSPGPAEVELCNDFGCDSDPTGFTYPSPPGGPIIESFASNTGNEGDEFFVVGQNFDAAGLAVMVCGKPAGFTLLDPQTLSVIAPSCAAGPAEVEVCTNFGCDSDPAGFTYQVVGTPFIRCDTNNQPPVDLSDAVSIFNDLFLGRPARAPCRDALDCNDSGVADISDGVYCLNFLFQSGPRIKDPYPAPGLDPTPDALPGC